jgi:hypothetical protein
MSSADLDALIAVELAAPEVELIHVRAVESGCFLFELRGSAAAPR